MNRTIAQSRVTNGMQRLRMALMVATLAAACATSSTPAPSTPQTSNTSAPPPSDIPLHQQHPPLRGSHSPSCTRWGGLEEIAGRPAPHWLHRAIGPDGTRSCTCRAQIRPEPCEAGHSLSKDMSSSCCRRPDETLALVPEPGVPRWHANRLRGPGSFRFLANGHPYGTRRRRRPGRVTTAPCSRTSPLDYSPAGKQIVFYRAVRAEPDFPIDLGGSLWVVNVDDSDAPSSTRAT